MTAILAIFVLRSSFTSSDHVTPLVPGQDHAIDSEKAMNRSPLCDKIPTPLAQALIHYTTSTIAPWQTHKEISVTARLLKKSLCNFLVFGLGHESLMWSLLNYRGWTVFLEEDEMWIKQVKRRFPMLESYHAMYGGKADKVDNPMEVGRGSECTVLIDPMCLLSPKGVLVDIYETKWDLIMVDGKTLGRIHGEDDGEEQKGWGKQTCLWMINRPVEGNFSKAFLCQCYMKKEEGRLRHFTIPSHREDNINKPFCPN